MDCCSAATSATDLLQLAAFGLLMSAGHCLGMCGPLVCAASVPAGRASGERAAVRSAALYHAGRLTSYAAIGLGLGAVGGFLPAAANAALWQALLSLLAAIALLWVALSMLGLVRTASLSCAGGLARRVAGWFGGVRGARGPGARFGLGAANGLLPCGPVYTVAVAALAAGGAWGGALAMLAFGAGTVPLLFAVAFGARWIGARLRAGLSTAGAGLAVAMSFQLALRGLAALEWVPHARIGEVVLW
ncbi:MAG: sulfite exporter TauE/SafE family protein [Planctomycetes bacterium]|nr:sulfite exporter TauE/SafE family protein [Planctomycetota bacterium]